MGTLVVRVIIVLALALTALAVVTRPAPPPRDKNAVEQARTAIIEAGQLGEAGFRMTTDAAPPKTFVGHAWVRTFEREDPRTVFMVNLVLASPSQIEVAFSRVVQAQTGNDLGQRIMGEEAVAFETPVGDGLVTSLVIRRGGALIWVLSEIVGIEDRQVRLSRTEAVAQRQLARLLDLGIR